MLTFEYDKENQKLEIHGNKEGLLELKKQIDTLLLSKESVRLMTPSWGGSELSDEK